MNKFIFLKKVYAAAHGCETSIGRQRHKTTGVGYVISKAVSEFEV